MKKQGAVILATIVLILSAVLYFAFFYEIKFNNNEHNYKGTFALYRTNITS